MITAPNGVMVEMSHCGVTCDVACSCSAPAALVMFRLLARSRPVRWRPLWSLSLRFNSTVARPFNFHIGISWAPKPPDSKLTRFHTAFSADSQLGKWRDAMLAHPKCSLPKHAGEDFFYHTEARPLVSILFRLSLILSTDAQWLGR